MNDTMKSQPASELRCSAFHRIPEGSWAKNRCAKPHHRCSFPDGKVIVPTHPHAEFRKLLPEPSLHRIPQLPKGCKLLLRRIPVRSACDDHEPPAMQCSASKDLLEEARNSFWRYAWPYWIMGKRHLDSNRIWRAPSCHHCIERMDCPGSIECLHHVKETWHIPHLPVLEMANEMEPPGRMGWHELGCCLLDIVLSKFRDARSICLLHSTPLLPLACSNDPDLPRITATGSGNVGNAGLHCGNPVCCVSHALILRWSCPVSQPAPIPCEHSIPPRTERPIPLLGKQLLQLSIRREPLLLP